MWQLSVPTKRSAPTTEEEAPKAAFPDFFARVAIANWVRNLNVPREMAPVVLADVLHRSDR